MGAGVNVLNSLNIVSRRIFMFEVDNQLGLLAYLVSFKALEELFGNKKKRERK